MASPVYRLRKDFVGLPAGTLFTAHNGVFLHEGSLFPSFTEGQLKSEPEFFEIVRGLCYNELYWFVDTAYSSSGVERSTWNNDGTDTVRLASSNVFSTKQEAEQAAEKIKELFRELQRGN